MSIFVDLISNVALLLALSILYSFLTRIWKHGEITGRILAGLLFGGVAVAGMILPFRYGPGVIFDGRSMVVSMAGLFGGPVTAVIATVISGAYRLGLGGTGALTGFGVIFTSAALGVGYHYLRRKNPDVIKPLYLFVFGVIVHISMLLWMLTLSWPLAFEVLNRISIPVMLIFPLGTVLLGALLVDQEERNYAQNALRESEDRYRSVFENTGTATVIIEDDMTISVANAEYENLTGFSNKEVENKKKWTEFVVEEDVKKMKENHVERRRNDGNVPTGYEFRILDRQGNVKNVYLKIGIIPGTTKSIASMVDITPLKRTRQALYKSETEKKAILDGITTTIRLVDENLEILWANKASGASVNRSPEEMIGHKCYEFWGEHETTCAGCPAITTIREKRTNQIIRHGTDGKIWDLKTEPVFDDKGNLVGVVQIAHDITDKSRLEAQLQQAQKMEAIGTLAGGIAHDFNNILGGIIGYAELAKMKAPEGSNVIAYLDKMIKSGDRAADLIKQILTLSRRHKQEQRPVQVEHIVKEALSLLRATLPTTIEIRTDLAKDAGIVNADPTQIHQVIMNLTTNAGHAMREDGGVLEVTLANIELDDPSASKNLDLVAGSYLRLAVSDTGHGMTSEIVERIFDPYFTTKDTGEGTGLGLSVAHGIVKTYGGTITAYSEPGEGTTFHVYLPLILEEEREVKESEEPLPTGSERILFIDDEEVLLEIGSQILEQLGYEVVPEKSSVRALELFRAEPDRFDLVITDMTMPHMTGDKLARKLMKIRPHIPIILCTGHSVLVSEKKAEEIGIKAFVMKPLVMRNFAETVRNVLDAGRSEV